MWHYYNLVSNTLHGSLAMRNRWTQSNGKICNRNADEWIQKTEEMDGNDHHIWNCYRIWFWSSVAWSESTASAIRCIIACVKRSTPFWAICYSYSSMMEFDTHKFDRRINAVHGWSDGFRNLSIAQLDDFYICRSHLILFLSRCLSPPLPPDK